MRYSKYLNESNVIKKSISSAVYSAIFQNAKSCKDQDGSFQCHCSVEWVKANMKDNWWYKDLTFIIWKEQHWKKISERLIKDNPKFSPKPIKELIEDISDFTTNGHSILRFQDYYIDPFLRSKNVSEKMIQSFDKYWEKIS